MPFGAMFASIRFVDAIGLEWVAAPVATFVLFSAIWFFAYGVDAYEREKTREREKGPGFTRDPFAP